MWRNSVASLLAYFIFVSVYVESRKLTLVRLAAHCKPLTVVFSTTYQVTAYVKYTTAVECTIYAISG